jgi:hypothetical protein
MVNDHKQQYIPGVCNIGRAEIKRRWIIGWVALAVCVALWAFFVAFGVPQPLRLVLFAPALVAAVGFLQAAWRFCAKFGLGGVFNFGPNVGTTDTVEQAEFRRKDRQTALTIIGLSVLIAAAVASAAYLIPL